MIWQDEPKEATLVELIICFEMGFEAAKSRKSQKYIQLLEEAEQNGYRGNILTIAVGSRGVLNMEGLVKLRTLMEVRKKDWRSFLIKSSETVLRELHKIWSARNWTDEPS